MIFNLIYGKASNEWIDKNNHVNIMYYTKIVDLALETLVQLPNSVSQVLSSDSSYVVSKTLAQYSREMSCDDQWTTKGALYNINISGFKSIIFIFVGNQRIARFYTWCSFFSLKKRTSQKISEMQLTSISIPLILGIVDPFE